MNAQKIRIDMTLKPDHIKFLKDKATKNGVSISAMNDIIIEDFISAEKMRDRVNKGIGGVPGSSKS